MLAAGFGHPRYKAVAMIRLAFALLATCVLAFAADIDTHGAKIAPLIDPAKLATLGERGANPRVQKIVYWLATARSEGANITNVIERALSSVLVTNQLRRELTKATMLRNLLIADRPGCLDKEGLDDMRRGNAATVKRGWYRGDQLSVDHVIPRAVVPELDNVIANLELLPQRANARKNSTIGQRQRDFAQKLNKARLLSKEGLQKVMRAKR